MNRKAIFDAVKRLMGRGMSQADVVALDAAINASIKPDAPSEPEKPVMPGRIGPEGLALIKAFEGCARKRTDGLFEAYPDPGTGGAPWTIGWGATGSDIHPGLVWTQAQCDERLDEHMVKYSGEVAAALGNALRATSQRQFDALVSFHYNTGAIGRATLTRKHIAGDYRGAADELLKWNRAGGRVMDGLSRRRTAERALYLKGSA